ncbi:3-ketosphinganine reductase [Metschnikowia bicuspidata]|uniref:3-ketodihydrosphingosine reductase TSC10 n=1 Tax=Metschnikowia bicuspidata TaxID=27322 RepID=A0A4P9ZCZ9_9ASCO|nr:3-ketosphinganine reductase [Metschnikowia bicuspidata]
MWFSKNHFNPENKCAVVIGASQGLGTDIALRLYQRNCSVVLVARTESRLQQQVERIRNESDSDQSDSDKADSDKAATLNPLLEYYVCDVTDYNSCVAMWTHLMDTLHIDPDYIFCCAGGAVPKLFGHLSGTELAAGMNLNYLTAANVCHSGFKAVVQRTQSATFKPRHIVLFSSVVGLFPFIGYGQYGPGKAALSALSLILRQELMCYNYRVSCVHAGNFASEGYAEENKTKPEITLLIEGCSEAISTMECCDLVFDRLAKGYDTIYTDFIGWVLGLSVLGIHPRYWGFFQMLMSLVFLLVEPIAYYFAIKRPIRQHHGERLKHEQEVWRQGQEIDRKSR